MKELHGYRIESSNINKIQAILCQAKKNVKDAANEVFHQLLSEEVTIMVDDIALNMVKRPQTTILEAARQKLMNKIQFAEANNLENEYNLAVNVQIIPNKGITYIVYFGKCDFLEDAFAGTEGLKDYSIESVKGEMTTEHKARNKKWNELKAECEKNTDILFGNLNQSFEVDEKMLKFESPADRAETRARHELTNRYLNMYACGQQIQPYELMRLVDQALSLSLTEKSSQELAYMKQKLMAILPNITLEMISKIDDGNTKQ